MKRRDLPHQPVCKLGHRTWTITWQSVRGAVGVREFLRDHGVPFEERRAFGGLEVIVRCTEQDALRIADALELVGLRELFGGGASVLIVRPERSRS
jgi:hypothetical protein